jgi:hypothetical protein
MSSTQGPTLSNISILSMEVSECVRVYVYVCEVYYCIHSMVIYIHLPTKTHTQTQAPSTRSSTSSSWKDRSVHPHTHTHTHENENVCPYHSWILLPQHYTYIYTHTGHAQRLFSLLHVLHHVCLHRSQTERCAPKKRRPPLQSACIWVAGCVYVHGLLGDPVALLQ